MDVMSEKRDLSRGYFPASPKSFLQLIQFSKTLTYEHSKVGLDHSFRERDLVGVLVFSKAARKAILSTFIR